VSYPSDDYAFREKREMDAATQEQMDQYIAFMKHQLQELIQDFSTFLIWFDGEWEWAWTHEMGMDMYAYLRGLNEKLLINNRVDKGRDGMEDESRDPRFAGDFATPEQSIGAFDREYTWETCMTMGQQWAWKPDDQLKSTKECIHTLLRTIGGDGNLLFNVGPMPDGRVEPRQVDRLKEMGAWVSKNSEAIYGTRGGPYLPGDKIVSTHKDKKIFLHVLDSPGKKLKLPGEEGFEIRNAYFLGDGSSIPMERKNGSVLLRLPSEMPDAYANVVVLELDRPASDLPIIALKP